ncbi:MAG: energy transducer TonB [Bacteroidetes bacterium]|nr:energy transducer TonB [Bacteroidota bacterium]
MEIQHLLHADYLDILFDRRNKNYGGYELRKHYNERTTKAALITLLATGLLCVYSYLHHDKHNDNLLSAFKHDIILDPNIVIPPRILPPAPPPATASQIKVHTETFTKPVITNDMVKPDELLSTNDKLKDAVISTYTEDGTSDANAIVKGKENVTGSIQPPSPAKPVTWVEQMPEFNGDFNNYIVGHIRYPDAARSANITGRVIVRFVVNEDGTVSDARVMQGIGGGCDEEAIRVINSMPKWKPGKQNGVAVKVYCSVPINFMLQ